jgi:integrase
MPRYRDDRQGRIYHRRRRQKDGTFRTEQGWTLQYDCHLPGEPRRQKVETFETRRAAEDRWKTVRRELDAAVVDAERGTYVEPSTVTLGEWLSKWLALPRPHKPWRLGTRTRYENIVEQIQRACIAKVKLQQLRPSHLSSYYDTLGAAARIYNHAIIRGALESAVEDEVLLRNVASKMKGQPRRSKHRQSEDARINCWSIADAKKFLAHAKAQDPQAAAFFSLALDSGARKGELCALRWSDLDFESGILRIERTLVRGGATPTFGPTKSGVPREIDLGSETLRLLRVHKREQAALKLRNGSAYRDQGLMFAKAWEQGMRTQRDHLGEPLQWNNLGERWLDPLIGKAGVKRISVHGLRHTAATLMLNDGQPVHVVAARLGHSETSTTWNVYSHVLRDTHKSAAEALGKLLHG